jgi:hypothetical protein
MIYSSVMGGHIVGKIDGSACVYAFTGDRQMPNGWRHTQAKLSAELPRQS